MYASGGLAVVGVFLLARHAFYYVLERRRCRELQKRVQAAAAQRQSREAEALNGSSEEVEDNKRKDRLILDICVICLEQEYNVVLSPYPNLFGNKGFEEKEEVFQVFLVAATCVAVLPALLNLQAAPYAGGE